MKCIFRIEDDYLLNSNIVDPAIFQMKGRNVATSTKEGKNVSGHTFEQKISHSRIHYVSLVRSLKIAAGASLVNAFISPAIVTFVLLPHVFWLFLIQVCSILRVPCSKVTLSPYMYPVFPNPRINPP